MKQSRPQVQTITDGDSVAEREYRARLEKFKSKTTRLEKIDRRFSRMRMAAFCAIGFVGLLWATEPETPWYWILIPTAIFLALIRFHAPFIRQLRHSKAARDFYIRSLARLSGDWRQSPDDGATFLDVEHPWAADLDLFGPGSLFQRINLCRTQPGRRKLAEWLTTIVDRQEIEQRQRQTESLRDEIGLRESIATIDDDVDWAKAEVTIHDWLESTTKPFPLWALYGARLTGAVSVIVIIMVFGSQLNFTMLFMMMAIQWPFYYATRQRIRSIMSHVDQIDKPLRQLAEVTAQFENYTFREESLQNLQAQLKSGGVVASEQIRVVSRRIQWLNNGLRNQFFLPLAWMLGLFLHLPHRIQRWKVLHGRRVTQWLEVVTLMEVVSSIAAFNFEKEKFVFANLSDEREFAATQLGHPLLRESECVRNDVSLTAETPLMLISGSNMSGKSTLLRSVGSNLVLTMCGAVVNAESLTVFPFQLGTAMRISDSLQDGRSLFFAVVRRLKAVVDLTTADRPVLFLLDEILSGTNSHDRRMGAEAVIRTLVQRDACGMVTTHDLSLTEIVGTMDGKAANMHFEDQVVDGQMSFDYQLRTGVVQKSNAIQLMRMMGLDV